jgi:hypothetical protein
VNQIGRHRRQPIILAFRPAVFDRHVVAIYVTGELCGILGDEADQAAW